MSTSAPTPSASSSTPRSTPSDRVEPLVDAAWLGRHLHDAGVRVVEVDVDDQAYNEGHIEGAVLWNVYADLKDDQYRTLDRDAIAALCAQSGIDDDTVVVFYGYAPALGFWLLELAGHRNIKLLDTSRSAWRQLGLPWSTASPRPVPTTFSRAPHTAGAGHQGRGRVAPRRSGVDDPGRSHARGVPGRAVLALRRFRARRPSRPHPRRHADPGQRSPRRGRCVRRPALARRRSTPRSIRSGRRSPTAPSAPAPQRPGSCSPTCSAGTTSVCTTGRGLSGAAPPMSPSNNDDPSFDRPERSRPPPGCPRHNHGSADDTKVRSMTTTTVRVAAIQAAPVLLDTEATIDRVDQLAAKAAADGAQLILFPETFVPGYPDWMWRTRPWHDGAWYQRLADQAVQVPGPATERLGEIAATHGVYLAVGIDERSNGDATLYNWMLYIADDGRLLGCHRKLMPTGGGRLLGNRRRLHPHGRRHAIRPRRWSHLLGELHADGPHGHVRPGRRHPRSRRPGTTPTSGFPTLRPHRQGRPLLRGRLRPRAERG